MIYYCLECDKKCDIRYCSNCERDPRFETQEHPGFISQGEIDGEIEAENFWLEYDER